jgi:hypothetical protein
MSIERSGVRTSSSPSTSSQNVRAEQDEDACPRPASQLETRLEGGTGVHPSASSTEQPLSAGQASGLTRGPVSAQELGPVGGPSGLPAGQIEEGDPSAELGVPRVSSNDRAGLRIELGHDVGCGGAA